METPITAKQKVKSQRKLSLVIILPANSKVIAAAAFCKVVIKATLARPTWKLLLIGSKNKPIVLTINPNPTKEIKQEAIKTDRKSTRLNFSHVSISYAVFCLKK